MFWNMSKISTMKFPCYQWCKYVISLILIFNLDTIIATKYSNQYLEHLFNKYGSSNGITFEGLEHLMENLGIGDLEFNPKHTIAEHRPKNFNTPTTIPDNLNDRNENSELNIRIINNDDLTEMLDETIWNSDQSKDAELFINMHDPNHKHTKFHADGLLKANACLSPMALLQRAFLLNQQSMKTKLNNQQRRSVIDMDNDPLTEDITSNIKITPSMFLDLCPALLVQIDEGGCSDVVRVEMGKLEKVFSEAWIYASVSVLIISLCGLVGIAFIPLMKTIAYRDILRFLVAIAVGTLCGDALMHLLPHALSSHDSSHATSETESVWICSCAFFSALLMYTLENLLPLLRNKTEHTHSHHGHLHGHVHGQHNDHQIGHSHQGHPTQSINPIKVTPNEETEIAMEVSKYVDEREQRILENSQTISVKKTMSPVAFMVILGDGLHNLTDGMAIGAAFAVDPVTGMATALAVLCHELPHELGDFALLIQSGVSIKKATFFNIVSSILGFIGMVIGLVLVGVNTNSVKWIYAATAGTFLYIGLADLIPEMGRNHANCKDIILNFLGIFCGGIIMLAIGLYEDNLKSLFEQS